MTYDDWKLDNAWDEHARHMRARKIRCDDCDERFAEVFAEDLTGYDPKGGAWLCERCYDKRCDYGDDGRAWPQARNE
jgi:formylmethanofuran dehydrogenase subunit E